ncbi:hypothetical protein FS749_009617 [Ceratobasidium sp. UAMH 11750]|nr:hypothetical protein FS749_009617 [Ceratobasidium sp. UAMH 11750]
MAPHVHTHYDYPEPVVAVAHASPVLAQVCALVISRLLIVLQARPYGHVPPGQPWARPMPTPEEAPSKYCRTSVQHEHPRQASFDHGHQPAQRYDDQAYDQPYDRQGYAPASYHQPTSYPQQTYAPPVSYQNYHQHYQSPVQHHAEPQPQYHAEPHSYRAEPQYHHASHQYQAQHIAPQSQYQHPQTYGLYAPHEHVDIQHAAQTASYDSFDPRELLNTPYDFDGSDDLDVSGQHDFSDDDHQARRDYEMAQNYQQVEAQAQYHQAYRHHQMNAVSPAQMHTTVAPSQIYSHSAHAHVVAPQMDTAVAHGYGHHHHTPHVRRLSGFEAPHEQVLYQVAHQPQHDGYFQNHQHVPVSNHQHAHQHAQNHAHLQDHPHVQAHAHHSAPQTTQAPAEMTHYPSHASTNPLQYPTVAPTDAEPGTGSGSESEHEPTPGEPEKTPKRLEAIGYQRGLEDRFRKRVLEFGDQVKSAFPAKGEQQQQDGQQDESAGQSLSSSSSSQQQQPAPLAQPQPIVPSQAHERTVPVASGSQGGKKDSSGAPKKPALACLFCRKRKIACGPPPPDSPDKTCNQCMRRKQECVYPSESRRGIRKSQKETAVPVEEQPTVHTFVHDDGNGHGQGESSKGKTRRKRAHEHVD